MHSVMQLIGSVLCRLSMQLNTSTQSAVPHGEVQAQQGDMLALRTLAHMQRPSECPNLCDGHSAVSSWDGLRPCQAHALGKQKAKGTLLLQSLIAQAVAEAAAEDDARGMDNGLPSTDHTAALTMRVVPLPQRAKPDAECSASSFDSDATQAKSLSKGSAATSGDLSDSEPLTRADSMTASLQEGLPPAVESGMAIHAGMSGLRMRVWYEQARDAVAAAVAAPRSVFAIQFSGSSNAAAAGALARLLGIRARLSAPQGGCLPFLRRHCRRPVVVHSPVAHHSHSTVWRALNCDAEEVPEDSAGRPDMAVLAAMLRRHSARRAPLIIGAFTAGCGITGIVLDIPAITRLLHGYGALAVFDATSFGSSHHFDFGGDKRCADVDAPDAVMLRPHRVAPGPRPSAVLVVRRAVINKAGGEICGVIHDRRRCSASCVELFQGPYEVHDANSTA
jgi:hypothetical protein